MGEITDWIVVLEKAWNATIGIVISYLPNFVGILLILLAGWILGRLARAGVNKLGNVMNRVMGNMLRGTPASRFRLTDRGLQVIAATVFWVIILVSLTVAAKVAHLEGFSLWLEHLLSYVPVLLTAALIIVAGYLTSLFVRDVVSAALAAGGFRQSVLLARLSQAAVLLSAVIIAIDQIGVDVSFLITVIAISLAGILGGVALAFGFGSRDFVANVIAAHNLQQQYRPGHFVRLGETQGEILELTPTSVILATDDGRTTVPAHFFDRDITVLVTPEEAGD